MASTLLRVSLRASRGTRSSSSLYAAARLLSTVSYNHVSNGYPYPSSSSPPTQTTTKPSLVVGGTRSGAPSSSRPRVNGFHDAASHSHQYNVNGSSEKSDLVVVLDMDECLIHSQFFSPHAAKLAHQLPHNHASSWNYSTSARNNNGNTRNVVDTFRFTLPDGDVVHVHKRPFLHDFLKAVSDRFETHIFTAAMEVYAAPVLNHLDPNGTMFEQRRWYRDHCLYKDGAYVKDLTPLNTPPHKTVLVDNNPLSFLANPENGILVNNFYNDPNDTTLTAVLDLLDELAHVPDVRPILNERFGLKQALEQVGNKTNSTNSISSTAAAAGSLHDNEEQEMLCSFE